MGGKCSKPHFPDCCLAIHQGICHVSQQLRLKLSPPAVQPGPKASKASMFGDHAGPMDCCENIPSVY